MAISGEIPLKVGSTEENLLANVTLETGMAEENRHLHPLMWHSPFWGIPSGRETSGTPLPWEKAAVSLHNQP